MTPVKLTSTEASEHEVVVMFDKITHIKAAKSPLGDGYTEIHLGDSRVDVRESIGEVFHVLARNLHGIDQRQEITSLDLTEEGSLPKGDLPDLTPEQLQKLLKKE